MKKTFILALAAMGMTLASCQSSTWNVEGTVESLNDGDTLYITSDLRTGAPLDSAIVKDGKFEFAGDKDTLMYCMIYGAKDQSVGGELFVEKGTATIHIANNHDSTVVGGTPSNEKWQKFNDETKALGEDREKVYAALAAHIEENISSEYGYFLLTQYSMALEAEQRMAIIEKMPQAMAEREQIVAMTEQAKKELAVAVGAKIPDFEMNDINGKPSTIYKEIAGKKVVIIDFWASWCPPCRAEMPNLVKLYAEYKNKGLGIVGISLDSDIEAWKKETAIQGITWRQLSDLQGWKNAAAALFAVRSIPQVFIVDGEGTILAKNLRGEALDKFIAEKLGK